MGDNTNNLLLVGPRGAFLRCVFIVFNVRTSLPAYKPAHFFLPIFSSSIFLKCK